MPGEVASSVVCQQLVSKRPPHIRREDVQAAFGFKDGVA